jgi:uncharacterized protein (DUF1697 family)
MSSMTNSYLALIRGVNNIGAARPVAMEDLRALFKGLGFRNVRTLLNSGNVIFSATSTARGELLTRIEKGLAAKFALTSAVTLLSRREVVAAVRDNPFSDVSPNPSHLLVMVPQKRSDLGRLRPLLKEWWAPEALGLGSRVAYLWCANGVPRSPLWNAVDRALKRTGTVRNIATLTKAMALVQHIPHRATGADRNLRVNRATRNR